MSDWASDVKLDCLVAVRGVTIGPNDTSLAARLKRAIPFEWRYEAIEVSEAWVPKLAPDSALMPTQLIERDQFWVMERYDTAIETPPPRRLAGPITLAVLLSDFADALLMVRFVRFKKPDGTLTPVVPYGGVAWAYGEVAHELQVGEDRTGKIVIDDRLARNLRHYTIGTFHQNAEHRAHDVDLKIRTEATSLLLWAVASQLWLRTEVAMTSTSQPLSRGGRKRAERAQVEPHTVRVITLRKQAPHDPTSHHAHGEYTCQWPVKEHSRKLRSGKSVKVRSHVKGPKDKPFRGPTEYQYKVSR